jgi:Cysteine rich repeat
MDDSFTRYAIKQLTNAAMLCLALTSMYLIWPQSARAQDMAALRAACTVDAKKYCAGVQPGGGRVVACLKEHKDELSDRCKKAAGLPVTSSGSTASSDDSSAAPSDSVAQPSAPPAPAEPASAPKGAPAKSIPNRSAPATSALTQNTSYKGSENFVERIIKDSDHQGMRAATVHVPERWSFDSKIEWHYGWVEYPISYSAHAENPDNAEAYYQYPLLRMDSIEVAQQLRQYNKGQVKPGERLPTGAISMAPQPPMQAMTAFIKKTRPNVPKLKWLGQQDLPDLAKALKLAPWPNQHGVAIKIGYDLDGQSVEEAFYGVYYISKTGSDAVSYGHTQMAAGMLQQTNWGFQALQSFRAPAGTLDKRMPMFCVMAKSMYVNPEWARLTKAINDKMLADFNQKLQQGYAQLAAAEAIVDQTMKQQAAFQANFDKQEEAFRNSPGADDSYLRDGGKRSAADHWDDLIRGVDTVNDPSTGGTTQLSNLGQYHFTDGFGNYRTTDDPNYTPEKAGEVGTWTAMTPAQ